MATLMERVDGAESRLARIEAELGCGAAGGNVVVPAVAKSPAAFVSSAPPVVEAKPEPGSVMGCCPDNAEHGIVRLIPPPGHQGNIVGEGQISIKSGKTGEFVPVYCCPFCNKRGK